MIDEENEHPGFDDDDDDGGARASRRARVSVPEPRPWERIGDGFAELVVALILAGGFFCRGYVSDPLFRGAAWIGCGLLGVWAAIGLASRRWRGEHMRAARWLLAAMGLLVLWSGIQLAPLPSSLPLRLSPAWRETKQAMGAAGLEFPARIPLATSPEKGLRSWNQLLASFLFFAGILTIASRRTCAERLARMVILVSLAEGLWGVYEYLFLQGRTIGAIYNPNHHAALVAMGLPLFFARVIQWKRFSPGMEGESLLSGAHPVLAALAVGLVAVVGWLAAFSRGSILFGGGIGLAWVAFEFWGAIREARADDRGEMSLASSLLAAAGLAVLVAALTSLSLSASVMEGLSARPLAETFEGRLRSELWRGEWRALMENPWTGLGLAGTEAALTRFTNLALTKTPIWAHNDFVQIVAEMGLPASAAALLLLIVALSAIGRDFARRTRDYPWTQGFLQRAAWAGVFITLGHAIVDFHLRIPLIGFSFLAMLALGVNWGAFLIQPRLYARLASLPLSNGRGWYIFGRRRGSDGAFDEE